jgi:hypothetical protein
MVCAGLVSPPLETPSPGERVSIRPASSLSAARPSVISKGMASNPVLFEDIPPLPGGSWCDDQLLRYPLLRCLRQTPRRERSRRRYHGLGAAATPRRPPQLSEQAAGLGPLLSFARSNLTIRWGFAFHRRVKLAATCDVPVCWSCCTGVCPNCETGLISGSVIYRPDPVGLVAELNSGPSIAVARTGLHAPFRSLADGVRRPYPCVRSPPSWPVRAAK